MNSTGVCSLILFFRSSKIKHHRTFFLIAEWLVEHRSSKISFLSHFSAVDGTMPSKAAKPDAPPGCVVGTRSQCACPPNPVQWSDAHQCYRISGCLLHKHHFMYYIGDKWIGDPRITIDQVLRLVQEADSSGAILSSVSQHVSQRSHGRRFLR